MERSKSQALGSKPLVTRVAGTDPWGKMAFSGAQAACCRSQLSSIYPSSLQETMPHPILPPGSFGTYQTSQNGSWPRQLIQPAFSPPTPHIHSASDLPQDPPASRQSISAALHNPRVPKRQATRPTGIPVSQLRTSLSLSEQMCPTSVGEGKNTPMTSAPSHHAGEM
ncbi:protein dpy-30-like protein [Platysternon megacephalum]|uniref:Protein dpy-30-like protein n=1 Tax=Platysternon megacephalum TaxID=55544 RepID=A0A4D9E187_9SAUR|nr:protein dpy-30-like protein [Platysternon megacephalum]